MRSFGIAFLFLNMYKLDCVVCHSEHNQRFTNIVQKWSEESINIRRDSSFVRMTIHIFLNH